MALAYADLVVTAPVTVVARAEADLVVSTSPPSRAYADLVVLDKLTLPLYKRVSGNLLPATLYKRVDGQLRECSIYKRVNGQLIPQVQGTSLSPAVVSATQGNGLVRVDWQSVSGATGYRVACSNGATFNTSVGTSTQTFTGLSNGSSYTFTVQPLPSGPITQLILAPSATAPVGAVKPLMGITGGAESSFNDINSQVGFCRARRTYDGGLPGSFASSNAASDVAAGRHSYWSWKPDMSFATNTTMQNAFRSFLATIPDTHKVTIFAWHEPENDIIKSGTPTFTMAQWTALQNKIAEIVRAWGKPNIKFGICLMGPWTFDTRSSYYSGLDWSGLNFDLLDCFGIDPYRTNSMSTMSLQTMLTVNNSGSGTGGTAKSMLARLQEWGPKPIVIAEWGTYNTTEPLTVSFINDAYAWMKTWNAAHPEQIIESAIWFNYSLFTPPSDVFLTGIEVGAYAAAVADSKIPSGTGTGSAPVSNFSASPTTGAGPLSVTFSDTSTNGPTSWVWQFGDGTQSTSRNPVKVYSTAGSYAVTLTTYNQYGASVRTRTAFVTVS